MFKLLLIWRYLLQRRVAWLAILAIMLIVTMVVVVLSVMSGLLNDTRQRNHIWTGDIVLSRSSLVGFPNYEGFLDQLRALNYVRAATPVLRTFGMAKVDWQGGRGARVAQMYGVHLDEFCQATRFGQTLTRLREDSSPNFEILVPNEVSSDQSGPALQRTNRGCIVGTYIVSYDNEERQWLHEQLLGASVGITVFAVSSKGVLAGSGTGEQQRFYYLDHSATGLPRIDENTCYVDFAELQSLLFMDERPGEPARTNEIRVGLHTGIDPLWARDQIEALWREYLAQPAQQEHLRLMDDVEVQTWKQFRRGQISPAEREHTMLLIVFTMIGTVGSFIIFAIFYMIVIEKARDIGILKTVGASAGGVWQILLGYGALVGLAGALLGSTLGAVFVLHINDIQAWVQQRFGFVLWDPDVYAIDRIPDQVDPVQVMIIIAAAIVVSMIGAAWPAWRAGRMQIVETLRVE